MSDYISKKDVLNILYNTFDEYSMATDKQDKLGGFGAEVFKRVKEQPTLDEQEIIRKPFERVVERLEEKTEFLKDCTKYGNKNAKQQEKSYSTMMMYEIADLVEDLVDIVKEECGINE